jgi:hypothetical protein
MACTNPHCECKPGTKANLYAPGEYERLRAAESAPDPRNLFAGVIDQSAIDQLSDEDTDRLYEILKKVK